MGEEKTIEVKQIQDTVIEYALGYIITVLEINNVQGENSSSPEGIKFFPKNSTTCTHWHQKSQNCSKFNLEHNGDNFVVTENGQPIWESSTGKRIGTYHPIPEMGAGGTIQVAEISTSVLKYRVTNHKHI